MKGFFLALLFLTRYIFSSKCNKIAILCMWKWKKFWVQFSKTDADIQELSCMNRAYFLSYRNSPFSKDFEIKLKNHNFNSNILLVCCAAKYNVFVPSGRSIIQYLFLFQTVLKLLQKLQLSIKYYCTFYTCDVF